LGCPDGRRHERLGRIPVFVTEGFDICHELSAIGQFSHRTEPDPFDVMENIVEQFTGGRQISSICDGIEWLLLCRREIVRWSNRREFLGWICERRVSPLVSIGGRSVGRTSHDTRRPHAVRNTNIPSRRLDTQHLLGHTSINVGGIGTNLSGARVLTHPATSDGSASDWEYEH
jgi:hypothetical protein